MRKSFNLLVDVFFDPINQPFELIYLGLPALTTLNSIGSCGWVFPLIGNMAATAFAFHKSIMLEKAA
jgi:hypothetical protein